MKIKYTITVKNNDSWPRINNDGEYIGNYLEWSLDEGQEELDRMPELEERINNICSQMTKNGLGYFQPNEEIKNEIEEREKKN